MVSVDVYVNETTRHADVILPAPSPLRRGHYDLALYQFSVRNVANYSPPVLEPEPELPDEWTDAAAAGRDRLRDGARRRPRRDRRRRRATILVQRELDTPGLAGRRPRPRTRSWPRSSPGSAPSGCST